MSPEVITFECAACRTQLTVPAHMAGISGPCPTCGQTVTSPVAAAVSPFATPQFSPPQHQQPTWQQPAPPEQQWQQPAPAQQPEQQWQQPAPPQQPQWQQPAPPEQQWQQPAPQPQQPAPPQWQQPAAQGYPSADMGMLPPAGSLLGFGQTMMPAMGDPNDPASAGGLPPRRAPGQQPMTSLPGGSSAAQAPPTQSRLIPGAPSLPSYVSGGPGMGATSALPGGSLFSRDAPPAPITPQTQALMSQHAPALNLGTALGTPDLGPASPLPRGRQIGALRPARGTNFIRLSIAALFLLSFLGVAAYFFKDAIQSAFAGTEEVPIDIIPEAAKPKEPVASTKPKSDLPSAPEVASTKPSPPPNQGSSSPESRLPMSQGSSLESPISDTPKAVPASQAEITAPPPVTAGTPVVVATAKSTESPIPTLPPGSPAPRLGNGAPELTGEEAPPAAKPALAALQAFLSAPNAAERAKHTLGTEFMKALMDRYYSKNSDGPVTVDQITFGRYDPSPDLGSGAHCIFHIENKAWEYPVPVMLEEHTDGWKVDWLTFIELKDRRLEDFFKKPQDGKVPFHVGIYRQHYFEDVVPNRDQKDAFSIGLPVPNPFRAPVFLGKDTALSAKLKERLPWEVHVWAVVELEWKKLGSQQWVELVGMPQMHWYSVPLSSDTKSSRSVSTPEQPSIKETAPSILKAKPVEDTKFPPGIRRSPATGR